MSVEDELIDDNLNALNTASPRIVYAGFWVRVGAALVDVLIQAPLIALNVYNSFQLKSLSLALLLVIILMIYKPAMEYLYGATVGKMAMKIKVTDKELNPLSLSTAVLRFSPWLLSSVLNLVTTIMLFTKDGFQDITGFMEIAAFQSELGFEGISSMLGLLVIVSGLTIAFNNNKQGLHDMIAGTYCIEK